MVLDPGEQFTGDAQALFGGGAAGPYPAQGESFVGSLIVEADGDGVLGDVIFGDSENLAYAASLPLQTQAFTEALFNQVANVSGFFTGLASFTRARRQEAHHRALCTPCSRSGCSCPTARWSARGS